MIDPQNQKLNMYLRMISGEYQSNKITTHLEVDRHILQQGISARARNAIVLLQVFNSAESIKIDYVRIQRTLQYFQK